MNVVLRGWHVLAGLLGFFGVIIAVNAAFITLAVRTFPGEDVRRSYTQGLNYNETLAARRAQAALAWNISAAFEAGNVVITITDRDAAPVDGAKIEASLLWPTNARFDHDLAFTQTGPGRYAAAVSDMQDGRWRLRGRVQSSAGVGEFEANLTWR